MSESNYAVFPVGVEYLCDECGQPMLVAGPQLPSGLIPHACANSHMKALQQGYPLVRFDRIVGADKDVEAQVN